MKKSSSCWICSKMRLIIYDLQCPLIDTSCQIHSLIILGHHLQNSNLQSYSLTLILRGAGQIWQLIRKSKEVFFKLLLNICFSTLDQLKKARPLFQDFWHLPSHLLLQNKAKGGIYFHSISEVYVDHQNAKSVSQRVTFCMKTNDRKYYLMAPSPEAMRIWVDVLFTGAEGYLEFQD